MQHLINCKGDRMNWDRIEGHWKQARDRIAGRHDKLLGALQANHGLAREGGDSREQRGDDSIRRVARENADLIGR
jgi:uncharacterized protein YjbJ (UPF0337 family)